MNPFTTPTPGAGGRPDSSYFPRGDADQSAPLAVGGEAIPMSMSSTTMASGAGTRGAGGNRDSMAYQNIPSEQYWAEPSRFSTGPLAPRQDQDEMMDMGREGRGGWSNKKKWIVGGIVLGVVAVAAIVAGVVVSQTRNSSSSGSGSGSGNSGDGDGTDPDGDPSKFNLDDRLHKSFYAMAYTPQVRPAV